MNNFRFIIEEDLQKIENNISNLIPKDNEILKDLELFISEKSKRIRSIITLLYLKLNNVQTNDNIINLLFAGELIHNASLLHDDVIDDADFRRGTLTLSNKYNPKISILSGDYLLSFAVDYINQLNNKDILKNFIYTTRMMSEAEIFQYIHRNKDVSLDEYLNIIYGKTASLFECLLKSAAILSNINSECASEFGRIFGLLFQINNDMSSSSKENDKKNGVKTITDILGIEKTNALKDNYKEKLRAFIIECPYNKYKQGLEDLINLL